MNLSIDNYLLFGLFAYLLSFAGSVSAWIVVILAKSIAEKRDKQRKRDDFVDACMRLNGRV